MLCLLMDSDQLCKFYSNSCFKIAAHNTDAANKRFVCFCWFSLNRMRCCAQIVMSSHVVVEEVYFKRNRPRASDRVVFGKERRHVHRSQQANHNRAHSDNEQRALQRDKDRDKPEKRQGKPHQRARNHARLAKLDFVEGDFDRSACTEWGFDDEYKWYRWRNDGHHTSEYLVNQLTVLYGRRLEAHKVARHESDKHDEKAIAKREARFTRKRTRQLQLIMEALIASPDCVRLVISYVGCMALCDYGFVPDSRAFRDRLHLARKCFSAVEMANDDIPCGFCNLEAARERFNPPDYGWLESIYL